MITPSAIARVPETLQAAAPPPLAEWVKAHWGAIAGVVQRSAILRVGTRIQFTVGDRTLEGVVRFARKSGPMAGYIEVRVETPEGTRVHAIHRDDFRKARLLRI